MTSEDAESIITQYSIYIRIYYKINTTKIKNKVLYQKKRLKIKLTHVRVTSISNK